MNYNLPFKNQSVFFKVNQGVESTFFYRNLLKLLSVPPIIRYVHRTYTLCRLLSDI
jgi:hypothetical protein